jgi:hypothetical protein
LCASLDAGAGALSRFEPVLGAVDRGCQVDFELAARSQGHGAAARRWLILRDAQLAAIDAELFDVGGAVAKARMPAGFKRL